ncbi:hypothetical protein ACLIX2_06820 [Proteus cibi]
MKNKYMETDFLYEMLRNMYQEAFPSAIPKEMLTDEIYASMIIDYLTNKFKLTDLIKTDSGYELRDERIDLYKNNNYPKGSPAYYIEKMSTVSELNSFIVDTTTDLKELHEWLESESYIASGRMTEKFMKRNSWLS